MFYGLMTQKAMQSQRLRLFWLMFGEVVLPKSASKRLHSVIGEKLGYRENIEKTKVEKKRNRIKLQWMRLK